MGKRRKRLTMAKYATKYAAKRAAMEARRGVIEINMNTGEEITEDETVQVITNKQPEPEVVEEAAAPVPEPQLQTQEVDLSVDEIVAEIQETFAEPPKKTNALKATKKTTTRKTTTKKSTTTRRKRATKKTTSAD